MSRSFGAQWKFYGRNIGMGVGAVLLFQKYKNRPSFEAIELQIEGCLYLLTGATAGAIAGKTLGSIAVGKIYGLAYGLVCKLEPLPPPVKKK